MNRLRAMALSLTALLLATACGTFLITPTITPRDLLGNRNTDQSDIRLSQRHYPRMGMHTMDQGIDELLTEATEAESPPSVVFSIGDDNGLILRRAFGFSRLEPGRSQPATLNTLYDLASLTKVIATTTAVMQLWERGEIDLDDRIVDYLPEYDNNGKGEITIRHCLTHTAGFQPFYRLWEICETPEEARAFIENCELENTPGATYHYSDVGFITLGWLVERVSGQSLSDYCQTNIFRPLGMNSTMYTPPAGLRSMCAATEFDRALRHEMIQGMVHDENCHFLGGVTGHAGLFSTVSDLSKFCMMILNGGELRNQRVLRPETIEAMMTQQIEMTDPGSGSDVRRGLGWFLNCEALANAAGGSDFSRATIGHTGFTGTAIQIDPERNLFAVFLSNRVHARSTQWDNPDFREQSYNRFRPVRQAFFDFIAENLK